MNWVLRGRRPVSEVTEVPGHRQYTFRPFSLPIEPQLLRYVRDGFPEVHVSGPTHESDSRLTLEGGPFYNFTNTCLL